MQNDCSKWEFQFSDSRERLGPPFDCVHVLLGCQSIARLLCMESSRADSHSFHHESSEKSVKYLDFVNRLLNSKFPSHRFRVYYNQASSANENRLKLINWYNGNDVGLATEPLLRNASKSYKKFNGRTFYVPVIHVCSIFLTLIWLTVN